MKQSLYSENAIGKILDIQVSYGEKLEGNTYSPIYAFQVNDQECKGAFI